MKGFLIYFILSVSLGVYILVQNFAQDHPTVSVGFERLVSPKINKTILSNAVISIVLAFVALLVKVFFGELREIERYVSSSPIKG